MSTEVKRKRRDADPVRVYDDGRLWYWSGGKPGQGTRIAERCGTRERAEARAVELRSRLAAAYGLGPQAASVLDQAMQDMLTALRTVGAPEGTLRQYKSNWNRWVPAHIGQKVRCVDVGIEHWAAIFDYANANQASATTVSNIARTLGVLMEWAVDRGYFVSSEPFGDPRRRKTIVKKARMRARIHRAEKCQKYVMAVCPKVPDIEKYAAAFEEVYLGYGRRLVLLAFGTGLRINELLALRHDSINLDTGEVHVDWQLDRYKPWPAVRAPKGGKTRTALLWTCYNHVAATLIEDSLALDPQDADHGWLFPRYRSTSGWADRASKLAREAKMTCDWPWSFHWLRHAFATYSIASKKSGGFNLETTSVQAWLGHARLTTTQDMYVERIADDAPRARRRTRRAPGTS